MTAAAMTRVWKWPVARKDTRPIKVNHKLKKAMDDDQDLRRIVDISWILFIHNYKHLLEIPLPVHMIEQYGWKELYIHEFTDQIIIGV